MYFLTMRASLSHRTMVPRAWRMNFAVRLIMPWRLPWACALTLPVAVTLKRFLAPLLVFNLGILPSSFSLTGRTAPIRALALRGGGACAGAQVRAQDPPR